MASAQGTNKGQETFWSRRQSCPADPRSALWCALFLGMALGIDRLFPGKGSSAGILAGTSIFLLELPFAGWNCLRESRRQPDRALEFSLAANALLLLLPGFVLLALGAFRPLATDLFLGGCVLAVAAAAVDYAARRKFPAPAGAPAGAAVAPAVAAAGTAQQVTANPAPLSPLTPLRPQAPPTVTTVTTRRP